MNPISDRKKAIENVVSRVLSDSRIRAHTREGRTHIGGQCLKLPLEIRRQVASQMTSNLGVPSIRKLPIKNVASVRPCISRAMGDLGKAFAITQRRRDNQLRELKWGNNDGCARCQHCIEHLFLTDNGIVRGSMVCSSMGFIVEPQNYCAVQREGQGRIVVMSDIRTKKAQEEGMTVDAALFQYVNDCVLSGAAEDALFAKREKAAMEVKE